MKFRFNLVTGFLAAVCLATFADDTVTNAGSSNTVAAVATTDASTNASPAPTVAPADATTNQPALIDTNAAVPIAANTGTNGEWEARLQLARREHRENTFADSIKLLEIILKTNATPLTQKYALFELAAVTEDSGQFVKAQQIWAQYLHVYSDDPQVPEVLLRQGLLYRKMGANNLAISKFYAVMSSAVKLKEDNFEHYKTLVTQAQTEIANSYFLDAKFDEAADFYNRILKGGDAESNRTELEAKLIRSLAYRTNYSDTIARAQSFLDRFPQSPDLPEVRFLFATALKENGRNSDSMQQVLLLLQSQEENSKKDPGTWAYWQRRAGNEIANQLYKEGDYGNALQIYLSLAELDKAPEWQIPVFYQIGLVYEQLLQWEKATATYTHILDLQKGLTDATRTPALASMLDMARWRKDYIAWMQNARLSSLTVGTDTASPTNHSSQ